MSLAVAVILLVSIGSLFVRLFPKGTPMASEGEMGKDIQATSKVMAAKERDMVHHGAVCEVVDRDFSRIMPVLGCAVRRIRPRHSCFFFFLA